MEPIEVTEYEVVRPGDRRWDMTTNHEIRRHDA
jgi:hypothetical protein